MNKRKIIAWTIVAIIFGMIIYQSLIAKIGGYIMTKMMAKPPIVEVTEATEKDIYTKVESAGRIDAKYSVEIVPRVKGFLKASYFKEGDFVKAGQILFLVEPEQYLYALQQAQANVKNIQAQLTFAEKQQRRATELVKQDFIAKAAYDDRVATRDALRAQLDLAKASLRDAQRNYNYTHIKAPVAGKIGRIFITEGNYVTDTDSVITKIISTSPIYALFNLKSDDYLKFRKGDDIKADLSNMKVKIKLADGSLYNEDSKVEFVDNTVEPSVGTIALRATFVNKDNLLVPNDYINVVATSIKPTRVTLVPQIAVMDSQDGYYVWRIDDKGKTYKQPIKISSQEGDSWIVLEGLKKGDQVISKGLLKLKPDIKVEIAKPVTDDTATEKKENNDK